MFIFGKVEEGKEFSVFKELEIFQRHYDIVCFYRNYISHHPSVFFFVWSNVMHLSPHVSHGITAVNQTKHKFVILQ